MAPAETITCGFQFAGSEVEQAEWKHTATPELQMAPHLKNSEKKTRKTDMWEK